MSADGKGGTKGWVQDSLSVFDPGNPDHAALAAKVGGGDFFFIRHLRGRVEVYHLDDVNFILSNSMVKPSLKERMVKMAGELSSPRKEAFAKGLREGAVQAMRDLNPGVAEEMGALRGRPEDMPLKEKPDATGEGRKPGEGMRFTSPKRDWER